MVLTRIIMKRKKVWIILGSLIVLLMIVFFRLEQEVGRS